METFIFYAWPIYLILGITMMFLTAASAVFWWTEGRDDYAQKCTFWAVSSIWWPLIVVYYIGKAFVHLMIIAYKGALLVSKGN